MNLCEQLNDFLDGEDCPGFAVHLQECAACRDAVEQYERLSDCLANEPVPAGLTRRVRRRLMIGTVRRVAVAASILMTVVGAGWWTMRPRPMDKALVAKAVTADERPVQVTFRDDIIAVQEKSDSPNVTFLWVYTAHAGESNQERMK